MCGCGKAPVKRNTPTQVQREYASIPQNASRLDTAKTYQSMTMQQPSAMRKTV